MKKLSCKNETDTDAPHHTNVNDGLRQKADRRLLVSHHLGEPVFKPPNSFIAIEHRRSTEQEHLINSSIDADLS